MPRRNDRAGGPREWTPTKRKPKGRHRPRSWHRGPNQDRAFRLAVEKLEREAA
jgi:hypothetical protein